MLRPSPIIHASRVGFVALPSVLLQSTRAIEETIHCFDVLSTLVLKVKTAGAGDYSERDQPAKHEIRIATKKTYSSVMIVQVTTLL